jgi:hypothetical protein
LQVARQGESWLEVKRVAAGLSCKNARQGAAAERLTVA